MNTPIQNFPSQMTVALFVATVAGSVPALAQNFPTKPIRMLVGFAPGGGTDTAARSIAAKLSERLGQTVVIDNRPGAAGNIATELTVGAVPDGHTILLGSIASFSVNPSLYKKLPFDPLKDLAPLSRVADSTNILVTHPSAGVKTVKELVAMAKSKPLNGGSSGIGGTGHLAIELFNLQTGVKITHVPYKGGGPAIIDLLAGNIHLIFATAASAVQHVKGGKINALGVTTLKRWAFMPEIPTIAEAGVAGFEANNWYGFMVPLKTPQPIVARLNKEIASILLLPDVKDYLFRQGMDVAPGSPEDFAKYIKSETVKWEKVIKAAGLYHSN
ncbi:MAG TPA: tripartite tricarboxylate transporter substrate binding protein [Burkholderiales bacterium]|nr:tripartite tricarboxylate transporter substrate binding protein [Burkholderiales bacterium]